ncbi:hypothetical protein [Rhodococcus sp. KRD197]|uniref:hypothetical protein n=1 Tax=Rhodococcus sp. KRD197 TaxID=2729731 RepID=UPI0019D2132C|nr:hypothetical protein [Rhodococcus sp. KRD197]
MTTFNPNKPPTNADTLAEEVGDDYETDDNLLSSEAVQRGNRAAMSDAAQREANLIIGTTHVGAAQRDLRLSEDRATAERTRAQIDAQRGGPTITTSLRGEVGEAVSELLDLRKIDAAFSKVTERVRGEVATIEEEKRAEARMLNGLLDAALDAARAKQRTPDVLAPFIGWIEHQRPDGRPEGYAVTVFASLNERQAQERAERVRDSALEIEKLLNSATLQILGTAGRAADVLTEAGLSVDATADEVVDSNDPAVSTAWRAWREAVVRWTEVQSTRRWLSVVLASGFDPKRPTELLSDTDAERVSWSGQYQGSELVGVHGAHGALAWWLSNGRPAAAGVAHIESEA